jgi:uncharacterized protein YecE (DUF72 family)
VAVIAGTSGWQYRGWRGVFYPANVPQRTWLEYYARQFATVENNGTFYRLPAREVFASWRDRVGTDFVMTVKASRYLTHVRRLRDPAQPVKRLLDAAEGLGDRLGPVLLQLPPDLRAAPGLLAACLRQFPAAVRVAVEPRHESWWTDEVRDVLAARGAALCWADRGESAVTPLWRTADWGYLRLHEGEGEGEGEEESEEESEEGSEEGSAGGRTGEGNGAGWPSYSQAALARWAERLMTTWAPDRDVFVYFNNDQRCAAPRDAARLAALVDASGGRAARAWPDREPHGTQAG